MLVVGIVVFALGLLLSIAWHELGHYTAARRFGIRVPQFMVGFGPTIWSRQRGETEWGVKAIPLGGYIRMIGMIPPAPGQKVGRSRRSGPMQGMIDDIRRENDADFRPGDEDRQFWTRKPWQRIIVMVAGPFMNLVLALVLFCIVLMGFGWPTAQPVVASVSECVVPASRLEQPSGGQCRPEDPRTPAAIAGFQPGDRIVAYNGVAYTEWDALQLAIRDSRGTADVVVDRGGQLVTLRPALIENEVPDLDAPMGSAPTFVRASFLGLSPIEPVVRQTPGQVLERGGEMIEGTVASVARLPQKVPALFGAVFGGEERDPYGPVSVVGVSVIGGKVLDAERPVAAEIATMLYLLAAVNLSLFVLNLLPILPLDGGHMLPALWEAAKKRIARWRGRPDPGPVDLAKLMPLAYGCALVIMGYGALVILADIVNPVDIGF
jgi:membrane-associated protease RseP (regulator of RpoE activity)